MPDASCSDACLRVRAVRAELHASGPKRQRPFDDDFEKVALPAADGDTLRDTLIAERARVVIEIGLAYGSHRFMRYSSISTFFESSSGQVG